MGLLIRECPLCRETVNLITHVCPKEIEMFTDLTIMKPQEPRTLIPISLLFDIYCELVKSGREDLAKEIKDIVKGEK